MILGQKPRKSLMVATLLVVAGGVLAGIENLEADFIGIILVWLNNFAEASYNIAVMKLNDKKQLTPFEINFYFAVIGMFFTLFYTVAITGEFWELVDAYRNPDTGA